MLILEAVVSQIDVQSILYWANEGDTQEELIHLLIIKFFVRPFQLTS